MNFQRFAASLLDQCEELEYLRHENAKLREKLAQYDQHVSDELQHWNKTYGNILNNLVDKAK